jgi:DNA-binding NtrC family response regulator
MLTVEEKPIVSIARKNLPICVIDDEADLVDLTTDRLTKLGFPTVGTTNPQDALRKSAWAAAAPSLRTSKCRQWTGSHFSKKFSSMTPASTSSWSLATIL